MHFVLLPASSIYSSICPVVFALPFESILNELAFVLGTIHELEDSGAFFHAIYEITFIRRFIRPGFFAFSPLNIFNKRKKCKPLIRAEKSEK